MLTDTALPATLTAFHVALAMLRRHRARSSTFSPFVLPSFLIATAPWLWPTPSGLLVTTLAHVTWAGLCEWLAPVPAPVSKAAAPAAPVSAPCSRIPARPVPATEQSVTVLAVLDETPDIKTFRLARPGDFDFTAGQFVPVRVRIDGRPHVRCYSISSSPDVRGAFEISVRKQGVVSSLLHALLKPGASVSVGRPAGRFVYPSGDDRPVALLAGGVGITPLLSMLRYAVSSDPTRPVTLLYSARTDHDVAFLSELRMLAERYPQVRIAMTVTQPAGATRWRTGRIDAAMIRQYVADPAHTIFLMCGPAAMMGELTDVLHAMGVAPEQVRFEAFETARAASVLNPDAGGVEAATGTESSPGGGYRIEFARSGRTAINAPVRSILEAAEAEGVPIPSSCRSGVCQACRTRVFAGEVECRSDMLAPDDREAGFILPCVSWAAADCTLDA